MLNVKINDTTYRIKNSSEEFTITEFETICSILNDTSIPKYSKWSQIFIYLGIPEDVIDTFDSSAFVSIIKEFELESPTTNTITKEIIIDGYTYVAYDSEFFLSVKQMGLIEEFISKDSDKYLGELMAIIYKREDLTKAEHFDKAHIKHKAKLFREHITADKALPFIGYLSKQLINDAELLGDESI
jgi:hypothetical protein